MRGVEEAEKSDGVFGSYGACSYTRARLCARISIWFRFGSGEEMRSSLCRASLGFAYPPFQLRRATLIKRLRDETGSPDALPSRCSFAARAYAYEAQLLPRVKLSDF